MPFLLYSLIEQFSLKLVLCNELENSNVNLISTILIYMLSSLESGIHSYPSPSL